ncbi:hypothetical protein HF638_04205 [Paenibacillus sp. SZ31]|uniref:hypothetical protein n=1 Tax=Paenibacillus sp. SZ31 TaxID=2725555 RepID=UPI00146BA62F|nr:hypothetical protein [Paenibacillus sp. SZ31]NMI03162.1 hypothetical protein [Paenibacillus sp. SZ31]
MAELGEEIVRNFLENIGFQVSKIPESQNKTPDFEVYKNGKLVFYCEEKTLDKDDFEGCKNDSTYNAITRHFHTAAKQFESINPHNQVPNVLAIVNLDTMKGCHDLFISLTGHALLESGKYLKIRNVNDYTKKDMDYINLCLWFDKETFIKYLWRDDKENTDRKNIEILFNN